ncbi:MAG: PAS domain-containing protein [Desulfobulbaceae bacterium]|nr:PAS domain-containing protein [Desulfobulbaceae bacterium]
MENFTRWDDYLVAEHELIERCMAVLKNCLEAIELSAEVNTTQLGRAIDFLLQFGDKIHNAKEEKCLFPRMGKKGVPVEGGPLGVMLMEHEAERNLLTKMQALLPGFADLSFTDRLHFKEEGMEYLKIRADHIWKENDVLYPMGRRVLTEGDNQELLTEFSQINREAYGDQAFAQFQAMTTEVEKGGKGSKKLIEGLSYRQLDAIMEALPFEVTFVDAKDSVAYFNRLDKTKIFPRTRSVIGRQVAKCHPEKSVDTVVKIVSGFKAKSLDKAEFWIDFKGDKVLIRYFPVYDDDGEYLGVLEVTQEIGAIQKLTGQKRLLDR